MAESTESDLFSLTPFIEVSMKNCVVCYCPNLMPELFILVLELFGIGGFTFTVYCLQDKR